MELEELGASLKQNALLAGYSRDLCDMDLIDLGAAILQDDEFFASVDGFWKEMTALGRAPAHPDDLVAAVLRGMDSQALAKLRKRIWIKRAAETP